MPTLPEIRDAGELRESDERGGRWVTLDNGQRVKIDDGESLEDAIAQLRGGEKPKEKPRGKVTDTPEFKRWFGNSKVVDKEGQPLRVYRGQSAVDWNTGKPLASLERTSEFPAFNGGEPGTKIAAFFTDSPEVASHFAKVGNKEHPDNSATFPVYLSIQRPYVIDAKGQPAGVYQFGPTGKPFRDAINSGKYDGVIIANTSDEGNLFVALRPSQIKSATGNRGTFNPDSDDIRESIQSAPTLSDIRTEGEAELAAILLLLDERAKRKLRAALRRYGRLENVPQSVWDEIEQDAERETVTALLLLMLSADGWTAGQIQDQTGRGLKLSRQGMAGYALDAAKRAAEMAATTTATTRERLAYELENRRLDPRSGIGELDLGDIDQALDDVLNQKRRETTAANETTGAISRGQMGAAGRANEPGRLGDTIIDLVWRTEADNRVCPRCAPLNGTTEEVWGQVFPNGPGPEAHPNCRCSLEPRARALEKSEAA